MVGQDLITLSEEKLCNHFITAAVSYNTTQFCY